MKCEHCQQFFAKYQCGKDTHGECDCPKCQGYCECKPAPNHEDLMDFCMDHIKHFHVLPVEYAEFDEYGDEKAVYDITEYEPYLTDEDVELLKKQIT
jgi:hypothetical protein